MKTTLNGKETMSTAIINNRPVTIKTFKLEPGMTLQNLSLPPGTIVEPPAKVKLEPGLLQEIPRRAAGPLKVEIHDSLLDSDIDGALIIAEQEELAGNNVTLDYVINENGTCTCKLCGEVTQSRTHWYRHKYKVHNVCLFRCEKCEIFFKSKKGYEGHVANRHTPRVLGLDGRLKSKKEIEGLNKEMQAKKRGRDGAEDHREGESGVQGAGGRCGQEGLHQALRGHQLDTSQNRRQGQPKHYS